MKLITESEIKNSLHWPQVLTALEEAFRHKDSYHMPARVAIEDQGKAFLTMPASDAEGWFGVKQVTVIPENASRQLPTVQAWYTLCDPHGKAVMAADASLFTRIRTAGASALAASYLAPEQATTLLVIGTGSLAPWMLEAHLQVRDYQQLWLWGRKPAKAAAVAQAIQDKLGREIHVCDTLEAAQEADVISLATTARSAILQEAQVREGQHLDLVGAFLPEMCEVHPSIVKQADVFIDDLEAAEAEAGDLIQAQAHGWSFDDVKADLSALVRGKVQREKASLSLFKSVGVALEDLAVAKLLV